MTGKVFETLARDSSRRASWIDAGPKKRFADIDIAKSGHQALVQKGALDRRTPAFERASKIGRAECVGERLWPQTTEQPVRIELGRWCQVNGPEPARIVEDDSLSRLCQHLDVIMAVMPRGHVIGRLRGQIRDQDAPGHAQMQDQRLVAIKINQHILGPSAHGQGHPAGQPLGEPIRKRPAQIGATHLDRNQPVANQHRLKTATNCLDLW